MRSIEAKRARARRHRMPRTAACALALALALGCAADEPDQSLQPMTTRDDASPPMSAPPAIDSAPAPDAGMDAGRAANPSPTPVPTPAPAPGAMTSVSAEPDDEAAYVYDQAALRTYELVLAPADLAALDADPAAEQYVPGTLVFEGVEHGPVGIRYKGSAGGFIGCVMGSRPDMPSGPKTCAKLSMKVSFNWSDPEGRFHGLKKLQFHAMRNDRSLMKERLGYWLFRQMGLPAPRAVHARLLINGEPIGVFALVEQIDGRFTRARFSEGGDGNLYKEVWPIHDDEQVYLDALESNTEQSPSAARMVAFAQALATADGAELPGVVDDHVDRDALLRYLAVDRAISHDDGPLAFYCNLAGGQGGNPGPYGNHNYYWYEEVASQRLWLVAWDIDLAFRGFSMPSMSGKFYEPVAAESCRCPEPSGNAFRIARRPAACDKLVQGLAGQVGDYRAHLRELLDGPFRADAVAARLDAWSAQLLPALQEEVPDQPTAEQWPSQLQSFRTTLDSLRAAMTAEIEP